MVFSLSHLNSTGDLSNLPSEMKSSKELNFEILGAPIGDSVFCAKYESQKRAKLLHMLEDIVGSMDSQVALLLLHQCDSFYKMVHLAHSTPCSLMTDALQMFHNDVHHAFAVLLNALQWMPLATPGNRPNSLLAEVGWVYVAFHTTQQQPTCTFHL